VVQLVAIERGLARDDGPVELEARWPS
jgi:hypothetical protein